MKQLHALLDFAVTLALALVPGAIGAAIGSVWERGISWGQRFLQLAVGTVVSFYAARAIGAFWHLTYNSQLDPFLLDGVKFTIGMIAFKATPRFIAAAVEIAAGLPAQLRDRFFPKGPSI